jgi:hypothetical protein
VAPNRVSTSVLSCVRQMYWSWFRVGKSLAMLLYVTICIKLLFLIIFSLYLNSSAIKEGRGSTRIHVLLLCHIQFSSTSCAVSWPPCSHYWIGTTDLPLTFSQFSPSLALLCCASSTRCVHNDVIQPLPRYTSKTIMQIWRILNHSCNNAWWIAIGWRTYL